MGLKRAFGAQLDSFKYLLSQYKHYATRGNSQDTIKLQLLPRHHKISDCWLAHWISQFVMASLAAPQTVVMTTSGATNDSEIYTTGTQFSVYEDENTVLCNTDDALEMPWHASYANNTAVFFSFCFFHSSFLRSKPKVVDILIRKVIHIRKVNISNVNCTWAAAFIFS